MIKQILLQKYVSFIFLSNYICTNYADRVTMEIPLKFFNIKFLNFTQQFGVTTKSKQTQTGLVAVVNNKQQLAELLKKAENGDFVVALRTHTLVNTKTFKVLMASRGIHAVIILPATDKLETNGTSDDRKCPIFNPGANYTFCETESWNPPGTELMYQKFVKPVIGIFKKTEVNALLNCWRDYNKVGTCGRRCAAKVSLFMRATTSTRACLQRTNPNLLPNKITQVVGSALRGNTLCQGIHGNILLMSLFRDIYETLKRHTIALVVRIDSFSVLPNSERSAADSVMTGLITALAVMETIKTMTKREPQLTHGVSILLVQGNFPNLLNVQERAAHVRFPEIVYHIANIKTWIELSQLAPNTDHVLYIHHGDRDNSTENQNMLRAMSSISSNITVSLKPVIGQDLPPSFLAEMGGTSHTSGFVITNHEKAYRNKFYHSVYDTPEALNYTDNREELVRYFTDVVGTLSELMLGLMDWNQPATVNEGLVRDLLVCYLESPNCPLVRQAAPKSFTSSLNNYTMSTLPGDPNSVFLNVTRYILSYLIGSTVNRIKTEKDCLKESKRQPVTWIPALNGGECIRSWILEGHTNSLYEVNNASALWAISYWDDDPALLLFLVPSKAYEASIVVFSLVVFVATFIGVYMINKRNHLLFKEPEMD